jgi:hypothetical protein
VASTIRKNTAAKNAADYKSSLRGRSIAVHRHDALFKALQVKELIGDGSADSVGAER